MKQISLQIQLSPHSTPLQVGYRMNAVRIVAELSLATTDGWGEFSTAIVDTGAPVSMFPRDVWRDSRYSSIGRVRAGGIVARGVPHFRHPGARPMRHFRWASIHRTS